MNHTAKSKDNEDCALLSTELLDNRSESDQNTSTTSEPKKKRKWEEIESESPRVIPRTTRAQWRKLISTSHEGSPQSATQTSHHKTSTSNNATLFDDPSIERKTKKFHSKRTTNSKVHYSTSNSFEFFHISASF
jgi:hypothetical protein